MAFTIKQHDTRPIYEANLTQTVDDVESAVDLSNVDTIRFIMRKQSESDPTAPEVDGVAVVSGPAANGTINYTWQTGDTDVVDDYYVEIEVTWLDGGVETFPNGDYETVTVFDDLG